MSGEVKKDDPIEVEVKRRVRARLTPIFIKLWVAMLVLNFLLLYSPYKAYRNSQREAALIHEFKAPYADIPALLTDVDSFDADTRLLILARVQPEVLRYFETRAEVLIDACAHHYDFDGAARYVAAADKYYPDSAELEQERISIMQRKALYIAKQAIPCNP